MEKLELCGYPEVKNVYDMFNRFGRIRRVTDGWTNRHLATA